MKKLILLFFFASVSAIAQPVFKLPGWEYGKQLRIDKDKLYQDDSIFLKAVAQSGLILLFHKSRGTVYMTQISNEQPQAAVKVIEMEPFLEPVIKNINGVTFLMIWKNGSNTLFSVNESAETKELVSVENPLNFNYDFFVLDQKLIISTPFIFEDRFSIQFSIFTREADDWTKQTITLPNPKENEKGFFFPQLTFENEKWNLFYLARLKSESDRNINDKIYRLSALSIAELGTSPAQTVKSSGFSDWPPLYLTGGLLNYVLFPSRKTALYRLKLTGLESDIEYDLSPAGMNANNVQMFRKGEVCDFFYVSSLKNRSQISYIPFDFSRVMDQEYIAALSNTYVTPSDKAIHSFSLCELNGERWIFYSPDEDQTVWYSKTDRSVPEPKVKSLAKKEMRGQSNFIYYDFIWEAPEDPAGISAYATWVDVNPDTIPSVVNQSAEERFLTSRENSPGNYFFHLLAVDSLGNPSRVVHIPFTVEYKKLLPKIQLQIISNNMQVQVDDEKRRMAYGAFLVYIQKAQTAIDEADYLEAHHCINLASVILPDRMEPYFLAQKLRIQEGSYFARHKLEAAVSAVSFLWIGLLFGFIRFVRRKR